MSSHVIKTPSTLVFGALKGGSGATVVSGLAAVASARMGIRTTMAGLDADLGVAFGLSMSQPRPGLFDVLSTANVAPDAMKSLSLLVATRLSLVPPGNRHVGVELSRLPEPQEPGRLIIDASGTDDDVWNVLTSTAARSYFVMRPCLLGLRRSLDTSRTADGIVIVDEPGRVIDVRDVEDVTGLPVVASIRYHARIARAVDAGRLARVTTRAIGTLRRLIDVPATSETFASTATPTSTVAPTATSTSTATRATGTQTVVAATTVTMTGTPTAGTPSAMGSAIVESA